MAAHEDGRSPRADDQRTRPDTTARFESCQATRHLVNAAGHPADFFDYPGQGVAGNTHLLMQDDNNDAIARDVLDWLDEVAPR